MLDELVLIARNPCIQPSDVQKVRAIYHPAFSTFHDVVVCSTRGSRSVLSKLSGGDYDGEPAPVESAEKYMVTDFIVGQLLRILRRWRTRRL